MFFIPRLYLNLSNNMHLYSIAELTNIHFIYGLTQRNRLHLTYIHQLSSLWKDYLLLCTVLFLTLQKVCNVSHVRITPICIKRSTSAHISIKTFKSSTIRQIHTQNSFYNKFKNFEE